MIIGGVEERLQLGPGQRPPLRPALVLGHVRRGVPLVEHLHRHRPGPLLALADPPVAGIAHVVQEQRQRPLIRADRRMRPPARGHPRLGLRRRPLPRPAAGERRELAHHPLPLADQPGRQPARLLLAPPPRQHLLQQHRPRRNRHRAIRSNQRQRPPPCPHPVPLRACARCINRSPSPTDLDATSCHPAQPGASNPWSTACPAPGPRARQTPGNAAAPATASPRQSRNVASDATPRPSTQVRVVCRIQCMLICCVRTQGRCRPRRSHRWS